MPLEPSISELHEVYIGHVMSCPCCYAPNKRYCNDGLMHLREYLAHYLLSLDIHTRRLALVRMEQEDYSQCLMLKARITKLFEQKKSE